MANNVNGKANAVENPAMITAGPSMEPELAACTRDEPMIGPVHEKETNAKVNAMKKIPTSPPLSDLLSAEFTHLLGIRISNAPRNEKEKTMNTKKKILFIQTLVDNSLSPVGPIIAVIINPNDT